MTGQSTRSEQVASSGKLSGKLSEKLSGLSSVLCALLPLALALSFASAAAGQPLPATDNVTPAEGANSDGKLELALADAVALGIENNLGLQVERFDPIMASETESISWGAYDPTASLEGSYLSTSTPSNGNVLFSGSRSKSIEGIAGIETLVPYLGATLAFELDTSESKDISFITSQNPVWGSGYKLRGSLPLLKGLVWNEPWTRVKTSKAEYSASLEAFKGNLMDTVQLIENAYWNLVANREAVKVADKSLETAQSLLEQTQTEYDVGVKSKVEVVEAEAGVAARDLDVIRAVNRERRSQDLLTDAVFGTRLTAASHLEIDPIDDPIDYVDYEIDVPASALRAFENRPELAQALDEIERQEIELKFAKNSRLPQLDLQASFGQSGSRGEGSFETSPPSSTTGNDIGDSFKDWNAAEGGEEFRVGAVFSIPIGNVAARHRVSRRELELRRANAQLSKLRQSIILEVRDRARNLESSQEGIEAAERRRLAAAEQLRAERVRLEYGESTPFNVLLKEEDLVEAENEKIGALQLYRTSVVDLNRAQGTILKARNIVVEDAAVLR